MPALDPTLRDQLATIIGKEGRNDGARVTAESGARAALEALAVHRTEPYDHMPLSARELRNRLRARARQLGDRRFQDRTHEITRLVEQCAYEHWHRMLFARFLAENELLIHPTYDTPVSLTECAELASGEGAENQWELAGRYASRMLPQIFRPDDPVLAVKLAPEHQRELENLLASIPLETFEASDALGWVYQFWQARRKKDVNQSEVKIGADELPAVTQLFTEPYMVQFLLHNTLGAWWAGKILAENLTLAENATSEEELRTACALPGYEWSYLRFIRDERGRWKPAAGIFDGWPSAAAKLKVMDPCCGSGHFLVEGFSILVRLRMAEEGLSAQSACDVVLRDNLFGLEIDQRCVQIAAFALAFAAWTYPGTDGHRSLPQLNIACSGLAIGARKDDWIRLAGQDQRLQRGMERLHDLFSDASTLGSLIDPTSRSSAPVLSAGFEQVGPLLEMALREESRSSTVEEQEARIAAKGIAEAGGLLSHRYCLVATNVPYLTRGRQAPGLMAHCDAYFRESRADLATVFLSRCLRLCFDGGTAAAVSPSYWLFLSAYKNFRKRMLADASFDFVCNLGVGAFETISGHVVNVCLTAFTKQPSAEAMHFSLDVGDKPDASTKERSLRQQPGLHLKQRTHLQQADARILLDGRTSFTGTTLGKFCEIVQGASTGDDSRFVRQVWELPRGVPGWDRFMSAPDTGLWSGRDKLWYWDDGNGDLARFPGARIQGLQAWGRTGFVVAGSSRITVSPFFGEAPSKILAAVIPRERSLKDAVGAFLLSEELEAEVRRLDKKLMVTPGVFAALPFDPIRWQQVAAREYPNGLPEPYSEDPAQWLFKGTVVPSEAPLQVAVARLLGYRWPDQQPDALDEFADDDGVVCVPAVRGERSASDRLVEVLATAYGQKWHPQRLVELLESVGYEGRTLDDWLRDGFFEQHCRLFGNRPFIWHIWDGHREGFSALANCHKLDHKTLESLTYTYLGDWIRQQEQGVKVGASGAGDRLAKAKGLQQRLGAILEGEAPLDVFVRWKPIEQQPIGWQPDLDDGVRLNIRPFMLVQDVGRKGAGVLRQKPAGIDWRKDRGKNPNRAPWGADRHNDMHLSVDQKNAARELVALVRAGNMPGPELLRQFRRRLGSLLSLDGRPPLFDKEVAEKLDAVGLWEE